MYLQCSFWISQSAAVQQALYQSDWTSLASARRGLLPFSNTSAAFSRRIGQRSPFTSWAAQHACVSGRLSHCSCGLCGFYCSHNVTLCSSFSTKKLLELRFYGTSRRILQICTLSVWLLCHVAAFRSGQMIYWPPGGKMIKSFLLN